MTTPVSSYSMRVAQRLSERSQADPGVFHDKMRSLYG